MGGPVSRAPHRLVHKGVQRTFRRAQVGLPQLPQGPPYPEAVSLEGLRPGGGPSRVGLGWCRPRHWVLGAWVHSAP